MDAYNALKTQNIKEKYSDVQRKAVIDIALRQKAINDLINECVSIATNTGVELVLNLEGETELVWDHGCHSWNSSY